MTDDNSNENTARPKVCLTDGSAPYEGFTDLKENGQQQDYLVLSPEERAKGFVRPLRTTYRHVGVRPNYPTRDLTEQEKADFADEGYVLFEEYPEELRPKLGHFWTQEELNSGCGGLTTMSQPLAETYARNPHFYRGTFCTHCRKHFKLNQFVWDIDGSQVGS